MNKKIYEVFMREDLTIKEKINLLNKFFNKNWTKRTYQQRYKNYADGFNHGIEENSSEIKLEILAKKELSILEKQKGNMLLRKVANKKTRLDAHEKTLLEIIKQETPIKYKRYDKSFFIKSDDRIEYVIADLQYKSGKSYSNWTHKIFNTIIEDIKKYKIEKVIKDLQVRISFLSDDIEGHDRMSQAIEVQAGQVTQVRELQSIYAERLNEISEISGIIMEVVFVPWSNHGMVGHKEKYSMPENDFGLIMYDYLSKTLNSTIYLYPINYKSFIVETEDAIYTHGHQPYMRSISRRQQILGVDKDIFIGHNHHINWCKEGKQNIIGFPTCRKDYVAYERMAGFTVIPAIVRIERGNGITLKEMQIDGDKK